MMKKSYKRFLAAGVSAVIAVSAFNTSIPFNTLQAKAASVKFSDVNQSNYFSEAVLKLSEHGVLKGFADGTFRPNQVVTRAQAAVILASALGLDTKSVNNPGFKDVPAGVWYYSSVAALVDKGIMNGLDHDYFLPGKQVTRAEMAKMLSIGYNLKAASTKTNFTDVPEKSWFSGYVSAIAENAITSGISSTSFAPGQSVNRGQMAAFVYRAENQGVKEDGGEPDSEVVVPPSQDNGTTTPPGGSTPPPSEDNGGSTAPVEGPAPELAVLSGTGFTLGSTAIFLESGTVNSTYYRLSEQSVSTPSVGSTLPEGVIQFTTSTEIKSVQAGQYIQVYEADANGKVLKFKEVQITSQDIMTRNFHRLVYDYSSSAINSISVKFNTPLSDASLSKLTVDEVVDVLQITNVGSAADFEKTNIDSIKWDVVDTNTELIFKFKTPVPLAANRIIELNFANQAIVFQSTPNSQLGGILSRMNSTDLLELEHLVNLASSTDSPGLADCVGDWLITFQGKNLINNYIQANNPNYLIAIKNNADQITNFASLQNVIDAAN
ncbi:S-layer homology domain-containing protein [Bacillus sp. JJ1122]|uniref:S-layer homology domain-containing protein n=1 Tax=Bacillus sp. JJ1122 TaxID=3122951 RepID=UPI002FFE5111